MGSPPETTVKPAPTAKSAEKSPPWPREQQGWVVERNLRRVIFRIVSLYVVFGVLWIFVSDPLLAFFVRDIEILTKLSVLKGWFYVVVTALLLYVLLKRETRIWRREREARSAAEASLRASEERFQSIYHAVSDAVFIHDIHTGRILDVNQRMCEMFGCTVEQARQATVHEMSLGESPYSGKEAQAYVAKAAAGEPQVFVWRCRRFDRSLFWSEVRMRRARVGNEEVIVVSSSDITARKESEDALAESNVRFRQLAESIDEVFWIQDATDGSVIYVSPAFEKIWGIPVDVVYANPTRWMESIIPEDRERVAKAVANRQNTGFFSETYRIARPDGKERWIYGRKFPVHDAGGKMTRLVGISTDITERRILEMQVNHAQKMEAIGTLAGGIAHDFNNILGAITGYAELAKIDSPDPVVRGSVNEILAACKRAGELVRQILAFSRHQEQKRVGICLDRVVREACGLLRAVLPSTLVLDVKINKPTPTVFADATQMHQVVMNLCTNAAQALEGRPQARITVALDRFEADDAFVKLQPGARKGAYARLTVADNGPGVDQTTLVRIFEPFFTTKAPGKGTGLGLAVVHGIVQRHDGLVTVESHPGEGLAVRIFLPEYLLSESEEVPASPTLEKGLGHGQRILVIDDEESLVRMVGRILTKLGYQPTVMHDSVAAWALFEKSPEAFDLIISDLTMPGLTGLDFSANVRRINPGIPIILMTGFHANVSEPQLQTLKIAEILMKPIELKSLSVVIDQVLKNKTLT